jgi:photosystem II stability/assembly factor-like uncharacterized protein
MKKNQPYLKNLLLLSFICFFQSYQVFAQQKPIKQQVKEMMGSTTNATDADIWNAYDKVKTLNKAKEKNEENQAASSQSTGVKITKLSAMKKMTEKKETEDLFGGYLWQQQQHRQSKNGPPVDEAIQKAFDQYQAQISGNVFPSFTNDFWLQLGPQFTRQSLLAEQNSPSNKGIGRLSCITFHPTNPNIFWVGASSGGVWKTSNGGYSWQPLTDKLPVLRTSDIAVDPKNPNILYVVTGDFDYYSFSFFNPNSTSSLIRPSATGSGVFKSVDGGSTWKATGFSLPAGSQAKFRRIIINPDNTQELLLFGLPGIFRSTNGGTNWSVLNNQQIFSDVAVNPLNRKTLYASSFSLTGLRGTTSVFKSTDFGQNWQTLNTNMPARDSILRTEVAVSAVDTNYVYAVAADIKTSAIYAFYQSTDAGITWREVVGKRSPNFGILEIDGQSDYNLDILTDPKDKNIAYVSGQVLSWAINCKTNSIGLTSLGLGIDKKGVHPDHHFMAYNKLSKTFYDCNDGGLHKTDKLIITPQETLFECLDPETGAPLPCFGTENNWKFLSDFGLVNTEFYRIALNKNIPFRVLGGAQDNSHLYFKNGTWANISIADGMGVLQDYTNSQRLYLAIQSGSLFKSDDGGKTLAGANGGADFTDTISTAERGGGAWITPFEIDPINSNIIYTAFKKDVWKSTNRGETWQRISNFAADFKDASPIPLNSLAICNNKPAVMYTYRPNYDFDRFKQKLYKTVNGGTSWTDITLNFPLLDSGSQISYLYVKDNDPNTVWATINSFDEGKKVYLTKNGGNSWINISGSLPNVSANCIVYHSGSKKEGVYVGTDLGVFYKDSTMTDWRPYNKNLPNAIIYDLKIQYQEQALYAGSYGRGLWRTQLNEFAPNFFGDKDATNQNIANSTKVQDYLKIYPTVTNKSITVQAQVFDNDVIKTIEVVNNTGGVMRSWPAGVSNANTTLDLEALPSGSYLIKLQTLKGKSLIKSFVLAK